MDIRDLQLADFADPAVRLWGRRVLMQSELANLAIPDENASLSRALDSPWYYGPTEAAAIRQQFVDLYERVVGRSSGHALDIGRQSFPGITRLFAPHVHAAGGRSLASLTDDALFARYGDVAIAAEHLFQRAGHLAGECPQETIRRELDAIARLLTAIAERGRDRPALARQLLARAEGRIMQLETHLNMSAASREASLPLPPIDGLEGEGVADWQRRFGSAIPPPTSFDPAADRALAAAADRFREGRNQVYEELVASSLQARMTEQEVAEAIAQTEDPFFSNAVDSISTQLEHAAPNAALGFLRTFSLRSSYAGTILLTAVAERRFGRNSNLFQEQLKPPLLRGLAGDRLPPAEWEEAPQDASLLPEKLSLLLEQAKRTGQRIHLEFGGATHPQGAMIATQYHDDMVISIDPQANKILWRNLVVVHAPNNFFFLRGFAEEAALFAHDDPFAESATIVHPQAYNLPRLLFSALLSVRPGGTIDLYHRSLETPEYMWREDVAWLEELGATIDVNTFSWDRYEGPHAGQFVEGEEIVHLRITVPALDTNAAGTPDGTNGSEDQATGPLRTISGPSAAGHSAQEAARKRIPALTAQLQSEFDFRRATRQQLPMEERVFRRDILRDNDRDWIPEQRRLERPGADRLFDDAAELVGLHLHTETPEHITPLLEGFALPKNYERAILLSGAYAFRVGAESDLYRTLFYPAIVRPIISYLPRPEPLAFEDALVPPVEAIFPTLLATAEREGREIHLEFGGFMTPDGIRIANEQPELLVASIDPTASTIVKELIPATAQYENFIHLRGDAERIAPWAALNPFASSASIVAPSPATLDGLMLSALLAVRPGGTITIFSLERESMDIPFLHRLNLPVEQRSFRWSLQEGPYSTYLREGEIVTRTDIRVRAFGETGMGSPPLEGTDDAKSSAIPNTPAGNAASAAHFAGFADDPTTASPSIALQILLQDGGNESEPLLDVANAPAAPFPAAAAARIRPTHLPKAK